MQRTLQLHQHVSGEQNAKGPPSQSYRYQLLRTTGTYIEHAVPDSTPLGRALEIRNFWRESSFLFSAHTAESVSSMSKTVRFSKQPVVVGGKGAKRKVETKNTRKKKRPDWNVSWGRGY